VDLNAKESVAGTTCHTQSVGCRCGNLLVNKLALNITARLQANLSLNLHN